MKSIKESLMESLKNWLFKSELESLNELLKQQWKHSNQIDCLYEDRRQMYAAINSYESARDMVARCLDIGVDIGIKDSSWAVVCLKGKSETVRFMRLNPDSAREMRDFLRHFKASNLTVDLLMDAMDILSYNK